MRFLGIRPDVPRLMMAAMDVFLFPSLYEGLGLVLIEAQAAGLISVVSDVIPEEADLFQPLVIRLPLSQTPDHWAERILASGPYRFAHFARLGGSDGRWAIRHQAQSIGAGGVSMEVIDLAHTRRAARHLG